MVGVAAVHLVDPGFDILEEPRDHVPLEREEVHPLGVVHQHLGLDGFAWFKDLFPSREAVEVDCVQVLKSSVISPFEVVAVGVKRVCLEFLRHWEPRLVPRAPRHKRRGLSVAFRGADDELPERIPVGGRIQVAEVIEVEAPRQVHPRRRRIQLERMQNANAELLARPVACVDLREVIFARSRLDVRPVGIDADDVHADFTHLFNRRENIGFRHVASQIEVGADAQARVDLPGVPADAIAVSHAAVPSVCLGCPRRLPATMAGEHSPESLLRPGMARKTPHSYCITDAEVIVTVLANKFLRIGIGAFEGAVAISRQFSCSPSGTNCLASGIAT